MIFDGQAWALLGAGILVACGSSNEGSGGPSVTQTGAGGSIQVPNSSYASVFDETPGTTATPDVLSGVWGTATTTSVATLDFWLDLTAADVIVGAARCTFTDGIVMFAGVRVADRVDPKTITILESKRDHQVAGDGRFCDANFTMGPGSYAVTGLTLAFVGKTFTKVHD